MIGFLRNPEVRSALLYAVVVTVVGSLAGMLVSPISALIVLLTGLLLGVPFFSGRGGVTGKWHRWHR